jgi:uncharacterized protein (TIGR03437 family)
MRLRVLAIFLIATGCFAQTAAFTYPGITPLLPNGSGGRIDWSAKLNLIAYDRMSADGYYDVHTMNPDGTNDQCLTCNSTALPGLNKGNPSFDFSGKWIIFQVEKDGTSSVFDQLASPGSGLFNDVWVMDVKGTVFYQLTNVPTVSSGVLHPHFNHAGTQVTWAQYLNSSPAPLGTWEVQIADLVYNNGVPSLQNIKTYQPGAMPRFYETHGFSLDDKSVYLCANPDPAQKWYGADIYVFTPSTGAFVNLTNSPNDWDEHANLSPDGAHIVWISSTGIQLVANDEKSDFWIMDVDGSNKRRLTWFNNPGFPESQSSSVAAATSTWSPDSTRFLGYVVTDNFGNSGPDLSIDIVAPAAQVSTASYASGPIAPDAIVALFSRNMSEGPVPDTTAPVPDGLGTTNLTFTDASNNNFPVQLYYVSAGQVNYYVPSGAALGPATVSVFRGGFKVASGSVQVGQVNPGIFTANGTGSGVAAATYVTVSGGSVSFPAYVFSCPGGAGTCVPAPIPLPANSNVVVELYGTGLRHGNSSTVSATAAGQPLLVQYSGAQSTLLGLDQVNMLIPQTFSGMGTVTINLSVDGVPANPVQLAFQ